MEEKLEDKRATLAKIILEGSPQTLDAYREHIGELRGVDAALEAIRSVWGDINRGGEEAPAQEEELYNVT